MGRRNETKSIPLATRLLVYERDGKQCANCFAFSEEIHHRKYRSRCAGSPDVNDPKNLVVLCLECHGRTHGGAKDMAQYRTFRWQKIGETEADCERDDGDGVDGGDS